jgi:O-antigen/teichoic acid export membrane protein
MPRYIARDIGDKREVAKWLFSGVIMASLMLVVFLCLGILLSAQIGRWTFGNSGERWLVLALLLGVAGMFCTTLALSVMRGLSRFHAAAVLQVLNGVVVPLIGILCADGRVERALAIAGGLWIAIACVVFLRLFRQWAIPALSTSQVYGAIRSLFVYGAPRVPGDIALFGLFALPAYAAVHRNDMVGAGFISVGLSLVQAIATVFAATGFVLLPYWSRAGTSAEARLIAGKRVGMLVIGSGVVATLGLVLLQIFLRLLGRLLLGRLAGAGLHDIRYVMLGAVPYVIYLVLRDYFDAVSVFPMNTVALTVAIAIQVTLFSGHWLSVSLATLISFYALGLLMISLWAASLFRIRTVTS